MKTIKTSSYTHINPFWINRSPKMFRVLNLVHNYKKHTKVAFTDPLLHNIVKNSERHNIRHSQKISLTKL